ncbi:hypothetical protein GCM10011316_39680 [Roseibium aquae]|uniref:DUF418 domain-containing protein n=1 Tax=Roseibium aquae TaxID=1323746 RepID=A0A916TNL5_9HYPH|nr:DUF418 domain-containing protein [Roseibium aquae]GGB63922.1 hypothetical protein GCM10011316_39680 [Roseibium aquae]
MTTRALMPDYLRLCALFGIVVVNVQYMAFPILGGFEAASTAEPANRAVVWLVNGLFLVKTYGLFSFMFGVGLAYQMRSAANRALPFGTLYRNRMIGLLLLGLAHACLFFPGDILVIYAITGTCLYWVRAWTARRLVRLGSALLVIQIVVAGALVMTPEPADPEVLAIERALIGQGGFLEAVLFRTISFFYVLPYLLLFQGIAALGWFCLGLAAVKSGLIDRPDHRLWRLARRWCLGPGVLSSLLIAHLWLQTGDGRWEAALIAAAPLATIGYLGVIAAMARPAGPLGSMLLSAGAASLSIYLGQSMVLSTIFGAYGLGLWNEVSAAGAVAIALFVTLALVLLLAVWRKRFALGPFEWLLRKGTYLGVPLTGGTRPEAGAK